MGGRERREQPHEARWWNSRRGWEAPCVGGTAAVSADPESDRARRASQSCGKK